MVVSVLGVMGVLIALTVWARYDPDRPGLLALDLVLGAAAWLGSPLLLWRPVGTTLVLTALAVLSPAVTPPATLGTFQVAERRRFPVAVAVGAAGVLAHLVQGAWRRPVDEAPVRLVGGALRHRVRRARRLGRAGAGPPRVDRLAVGTRPPRRGRAEPAGGRSTDVGAHPDRPRDA